VCDGIFVDGSALVLCESKSSVLRGDAKLSGKFVPCDDDGGKGIAQLRRGIGYWDSLEGKSNGCNNYLSVISTLIGPGDGTHARFI
jgi:hypothetical protein